MKKTYISPSVEAIKVGVANIIAASTLSISDETVDSFVEGVQLGREDNSNSSVWQQGW